jgi:cell shape-determining protein MreC
MRKISYKPYAFLALLLLLMLSMPFQTAEKMRSAAVATISPPWRMFHFLKESFFKIGSILPGRVSPEVSKELDQLRLQNQNLQTQLEMVRAHLTSEEVIREKVSLLQKADSSSKFFHKKIGELFRFIDLQSDAVMGKVIFREPASWSSSFWINVGEQTNTALGKQVIGKNSPVVVGTNIVGVIECVSSPILVWCLRCVC